MIAKSIRARFLLWLAFLLVAILSGFGFTAYRLHTSNRLRLIDEDLNRRLRTVSMDLRSRGHRPGGPAPGFGGRRGGPPPEGEKFNDFDRGGFRRGGPLPEEGEEGFRRGGRGEGFRRGLPPELTDPTFRPPDIVFSERTLGLFDESDTNSFYYAIWSPGGLLQKRSTNAPTSLHRPTREGRDTATHFTTYGQRRLAYNFTEVGHAIVIGKPIADYFADSRNYALLLLAAGASVLGVGLGGAWVLTTRALRPIQAISAAATRISSGKLEERINVADTDSELGQLATLLNSTFARLEAAFSQQKQFTGDAAHELRTPLTVIISEVQTTLARPRTAEEYKETLEGCLETAQRMRGLSQSLLELARFDAGQEAIQRERFDLAEKIRKCAELVKPLANERGIAIHTNLDSAEISADPVRIEQVITNLLGNAVFYNKDNGHVDVSLNTQNNMAIVRVADTGQGIKAEDLPNIFKRFYRADKSRTTANGRSGLGLAITKAIIDAHGGSIEVQSTPGEGTIFKVSLPLN